MDVSPPTALELGRRATLETTVIADPRDAEPIHEQWDELAVEADRPYCSPAWMLAWWRHVRTGDARLRTIVVSERGRVVAIAPFFAQVGRFGFVEYRLLGAGHSHRIGVLCRAGYERQVEQPLAEAMRAFDPRPSSVVWEGIDGDDQWPIHTAPWLGGWAGVKLRRNAEMGNATIRLAGTTFDEWFAGTSGKFRRNLLRDRRNLERAGGRIRRSQSEDELERDLDAFARLHNARWAARGGSGFFDERMMAMLRDAGGRLLPAGRLRLYMVELDGSPIAASVNVAAGGTVAGWATGMDDAYGRLSPTRLALLRAVEEAFERGEVAFDFGGGRSDYKERFANHSEPIAWMTQFPRGWRYPLTRAQLMPKEARHALRGVARRLPPERQQQLKRLLRRA
jgi:CelD/BcsL family acetyltransferase involved in cellulose biosynthesis